MIVVRFVLIAAVITVAVVVTPYALQPRINGADLVWIAAGPAVLWLGWPRRRRERPRSPYPDDDPRSQFGPHMSRKHEPMEWGARRGVDR